MRVLWLSINSGLFPNNHLHTVYNGGGWISSLQRVFVSGSEHQLGFAFICSCPLDKLVQGNTVYYPIYRPTPSSLAKIRNYYGGYKKWDKQAYLQELRTIIADFRPDIIHLFGMESPLATILGNTQIPVVVHLQGLLAPCDNAFFPNDFNKSSFIFPFSVNEWILRNGYIFAKNSIHARGQRESALFKNVQYAMGRTQWDYQVSQLLAPQSRYFSVTEVLRESFYKNAGQWIWPQQRFTIVSTISNTIYKGLDTILKTARLLKEESNLDFQWCVVGIRKEDKIVKFFERKLKTDSQALQVEYKGVLNVDDLCATLLNAHLYVHPSYIDNSPNSICEAQLLGMPVIGTYVGGIPSLIMQGETGWLVPANAPFELAYWIKWCQTNPDVCEVVGQNSYQKARLRHDKSQILKDLQKTYQTIVG